MKKKNGSAKDLWSQLYANLARSENAALVDPDHNDSDEIAKLQKALNDAGWPDSFVQEVISKQRPILAHVSETNPGINPTIEPIFDRLCDDVEAAMDRLKLESHARVARGIEPRAWAYASKTNVILTDESIITVSAFLFRFCGLVARAFTRTLLLEPDCWDGKAFDDRQIKMHLSERVDLIQYWMSIYTSFSLTGTHVFTAFKPSRPHELILFEQIARSMEIFVIAHEYGHHHYAHGKSLGDDPHTEEFQADQFALRICYEVERNSTEYPNPYLSSGAGGIIMLMALETLREVEIIFGAVQSGNIDTHPPINSRLTKFNTVAVLKPQEFRWLMSYRMAASRVMRTVHSVIMPLFKQMPEQFVKQVSELRVHRE
jgi:hypothetical protein